MMGAGFWVHARGQWRRLEVPSGRVCGWAGRPRFCFVRRGRLQLAPAAAVLRGLRALQENQPTTVRKGIPLSQRRRRVAPRAVPPRAVSPHCCCRRAAADARNALVQLNLTALQPATAPQKSDAAVQANAKVVGEQTQTEQPSRKRSPPPPPPDASDASDSSVPPCKELIVNEEDVAALRRFLARDRSGLFAVDLRRFDADDAYKSALFYRINPLVCVARDPRIPAMLRQQRQERRSLVSFAGSLGLRAVGEVRARATARYRMRPRPHSSDKENRRAAADASPNKSANKSRNARRNSRRVVDSSDSSDSDSDFQSRCRVPAPANKKLAYERNTRSKFAEIRSKYEKERKKERDDDVRSKYLVRPRNVRVEQTETAGNSGSNDNRSQKNDDQPKDREILSLIKDKEGNDKTQAKVHKSGDSQRNATAPNDNKDLSRERSRSKDTDRRRSLRVRESSPSILTRKVGTAQRERQREDSSENSDSTDSNFRNSRSRDRRRRLLRNGRSSDQSKDPKHSSPSKSVDSKDKKRNDTCPKDRELSVDRSKDGSENKDSTDLNFRNSRSRDRRRRLLRNGRIGDQSKDPKHSSQSKSVNSKDKKRNDSSENSDSTDLNFRSSRSRDRRRRLLRNGLSSDQSKEPKHSSPSKSVDSKDKKRNDTRPKDRELSVDRSKDRRLNGESSKESVAIASKRALPNSRSPSKTNIKTKMKGKVRKVDNLEDSDGSESAWATKNGTKDSRDESSQPKEKVQGKDGESSERTRLRRSTAHTGSVFPPQRREYSSLEDHAIVQWLSLGSRARRVNGNAVWRELQEQFSAIAGRARSWHSLRNRYLRGVLPALGALALPPAQQARLRAAQAQGEIKSRRRAPVPNPLLTLPAVRSAWGARPGARGLGGDDTQDTPMPATSESEPTQRTLRSSTTLGSPRRAPKPHSHSATSSRRRQPSPTYSEVTRRFGAGHAASTPEPAPRDVSPHKKTRKLFNPKTAM